MGSVVLAKAIGEKSIKWGSRLRGRQSHRGGPNVRLTNQTRSTFSPSLSEMIEIGLDYATKAHSDIIDKIAKSRRSR